MLTVLGAVLAGWVVPAGAQTGSTISTPYTPPDMPSDCPEAQQYDPNNPFDPEGLCQEPSLMARALAGMLNWLYQALAMLVRNIDTQHTVFGCRDPKGGCIALSDGVWEVFGVASWETYDDVITSWQWTARTLGTAMFLIAVVWVAYEYMFSGLNPDSRVSLSERIQWMIFAVVMMALAPVLVGMALKINLTLVRLFAEKAGVFSLQTAVTEALARGQVQMTIGVPLALFATIFLRLALHITYLTRSWVVSILWGLAPLLGGAMLLVPKLRGVVGQYWRLLLGEIFMQSIHALLLSFLFTWLGRVSSIDPLLIFSLVFGVWMFSSALRGVLFGPGTGIAQAVGIGSAVAATAFAINAYRNVSSTVRGVAGATAGAMFRGRGGVAGADGTGPIGQDVAGAPSGTSASQASGEVLRSPLPTQSVERWRQLGSTIGRLAFGTAAGIAGAALGASIGDHRIGESVGRIGADVGERIGHAAAGGMLGGVAGAQQTVRAMRQTYGALKSAVSDLSTADRLQLATAAVGGAPAAFAQTREGVRLAATQLGATVGYGIGGRVGAWLGGHLGGWAAAGLSRMPGNTIPSVAEAAEAGADLSIQPLSQVFSQMKPGDELFVQASHHGAFAELRSTDGSVRPVLLKGGDPSLPRHGVVQGVRYQLTEILPGRHAPVERGRFGYAPHTVARPSRNPVPPGMDAHYHNG
ncbi:hypothetical protein [Thermaerobacter litoralis]